MHTNEAKGTAIRRWGRVFRRYSRSAAESSNCADADSSDRTTGLRTDRDGLKAVATKPH
jgi:hypothetical protein